ncbi:MAG TPA: ATP-binding cassette domain-containing protein [Polyangiaceae bacterium]|jgi:molybdate transport system ATP-binding protein
MSGDSGALRVNVRLVGDFALDVEFDVPPGVTVLFGPSGSGKSTTLALIAGLRRPTLGRISLGDEVWFDSDARVHVPVHRRQVAFVFQTLALFPHMTAQQNVEYGMVRALEPKARGERAVALLERLRVPHLAGRRPPTFSGGEAQRVALARALAMRPRVMLLDEPFSALDRELRAELLADLRESIRELAVPTLFVTHHRQEARALGERVVLLDAGKVLRVAKVEEILGGAARDLAFDETPLDPDGVLRS